MEKESALQGLYGMPGLGKTTLARAFCLHYFVNRSDGRAFYVDFCEDERAKLFFDTFIKGESLLLVIDNISDENIEQVKYYLGRIELGENSRILFCTRSLNLLEKHFRMDRRFCMHVPRLKNEEAVAILLKLVPDSLEKEMEAWCIRRPEVRIVALKCAKKCLFKVERGITAFHPLALKVLNGHLFLNPWSSYFYVVLAEMHELANGGGEYCKNGMFGVREKAVKAWGHCRQFLPTNWVPVINDVFALLDKVFERMEYEWRTILIFLVRRVPPNMPSEKAFECLSMSYNKNIWQIKKAVSCLQRRAFIEEIQPTIRIHECLKEFALRNYYNKYDTLRITPSGVESCESQVPVFMQGEVSSDISLEVSPMKGEVSLDISLDVSPMKGEARLCQLQELSDADDHDDAFYNFDDSEEESDIQGNEDDSEEESEIQGNVDNSEKESDIQGVVVKSNGKVY